MSRRGYVRFTNWLTLVLLVETLLIMPAYPTMVW